MRSAMELMCAIVSAAMATAFTPKCVSDECPALPRTRQRLESIPLCARTTPMLVGSPITHARGLISRRASSSSRPFTPMQPTSSS